MRCLQAQRLVLTLSAFFFQLPYGTPYLVILPLSVFTYSLVLWVATCITLLSFRSSCVLSIMHSFMNNNNNTKHTAQL